MLEDAPFIAATIAFASADIIAGVSGAIVSTGTDTTAVVVNHLSVCSRESFAQCFFYSLELDELSAPDLQLKKSSSCSGSCADSGSTGEFVVPVSGPDGVEA